MTSSNNREHSSNYSGDDRKALLAKINKLEKQLYDSEGMLHFLSHQGLLAIVVIQDGLLKYVNRAAADLLEYSIEEMTSWEPNEFAKAIHPDDRVFAMTQAQKKQRGDKDVVTQYSYRMYTRTGRIKWINQYSKTVTYNGRNADFVSFIDISDHKETEDTLQRAHDDLEERVNRRTVELTEANRQLKRRIYDLYTIFELSRNFNAVLNYETLLDSFVLTSLGQMGVAKAVLYLPREIGGRKFHLARTKGSPPFPEKEIVIDPEDEFGKYMTAYNRPIFVRSLVDRMPTEQNLNFAEYFDCGLIVPLIFQTKLRGVLILSGKESGQPFQDEDTEFLSILANQTAVSIENARLYESEKEALQKLHKIQKLLLQTERLAVLGELSAKVAHEVNNPLGIIKNYLDLISREADEEYKQKEYLTIIRQEINRIAIIIKQLLNMGRPIHIAFSKIDIKEILRDVIAMLKRQLDSSNVTISLESDNSLPAISAWPDGLKQVFMNLIINARDAMPDGGQIVIKLSHDESKVQILFEDSGPGIDQKHLPHIFEPFYTTKESDAGTGLGLSVSYRIMKNHNGNIEYRNIEKGGCFRIELPIEQEETEYEWRL
jgi:PAS domain S-box-containing protein